MPHTVEGTVAGPPERRAGAFEGGPGNAEVRASGVVTGQACWGSRGRPRRRRNAASGGTELTAEAACRGSAVSAP
ncbi:hypothetical protein HPB50_028427 [Hyalomma asiaticum]|nr:hypothetical protein HPB50_028427 [Hyalomma asiaticum]